MNIPFEGNRVVSSPEQFKYQIDVGLVFGCINIIGNGLYDAVCV